MISLSEYYSVSAIAIGVGVQRVAVGHKWFTYAEDELTMCQDLVVDYRWFPRLSKMERN